MVMEHTAEPVHRYRKSFWIFLVIAVAAMLFMRWFSENLSGSDIVAFEMAKTVDKATSIMAGWDEALRNRYLHSIYADFLFIIGYAGTLFYGCRLLGRLSGNFILRKAGLIFSWLGVGAGLCDVLENGGMLYSIKKELLPWMVHFTYDMAVIKFSFVFIAVLYMIVSALFWITKGKND